MDILPAIDLKDGKAVRLTKGVMDSAKIYSNEPVEIAKYFEDIGSKWLHLVDLNGAFKGNPANLVQIKKIVKNTSLQIELGGGIRDEDTIKMYLDMGINRLILGSIALKNPDFVKQMALKYPIVVGIDAIDGYVAVEGWAKISKIKATTLAKEFSKAGVKAIICTDISKDGMLSGINLDYTLSIKASSNLPTIASGGVKDIQDIIKCKEANIDGVIVGKAFYENKLDLKEAFEVINE
jgi:phosphoribosylformimino-5-aminoimidazole carboxamide ribotide isomerase